MEYKNPKKSCFMYLHHLHFKSCFRWEPGLANSQSDTFLYLFLKEPLWISSTSFFKWLNVSLLYNLATVYVTALKGTCFMYHLW